MNAVWRQAVAALALALAGLVHPMAGSGTAQAQDMYEWIRPRGAAPAQRQSYEPAPQLRLPSLGAIFGTQRRAAAPSYIPEVTIRPRPGAPGPQSRPQRAGPRPSAGQGDGDSDFEMPGGPRAFCVRTCDGFYFPAGPSLGSDGRRAQQFVCNTMCPGTEVQLFTVESQGTIEDAVGPRGQRYAGLRTAFRFRERIEAGCTCAGDATRGLARLPLTHDFTLREGDVVVTEAGVRIFAGASRFPYRASDFVRASSYSSRLSPDVRRRVAEIEAGIQGRDGTTQAPVARMTGGPARRQTALGPVPPTDVQTSVTSRVVNGVRVLEVSRRGETELR